MVDNERLTNDVGNSWYVNCSVGVSGYGLITDPFKTLKEAINKASNGDTIYVAPGIYKGSGNVGLSLSKQLTIKRWTSVGDVIFDGGSSSVIFTLNNNVVISSLIFRNIS